MHANVRVRACVCETQTLVLSLCFPLHWGPLIWLMGLAAVIAVCAAHTHTHTPEGGRRKQRWMEDEEKKESLLLSVDLFDGDSVAVKTWEGRRKRTMQRRNQSVDAGKDGWRVFLTSHGSWIAKVSTLTSHTSPIERVSKYFPLRGDYVSLGETLKPEVLPSVCEWGRMWAVA